MAGNQNITGVNVSGNLHANDINVVIATQPRDPLPKNIRFNVEKPIQTFTGRETFLKELQKCVGMESQDFGVERIAVLTQAPISVVAATGGIGKTETVRMYIQLHAQEYDHIIWIDAEGNSSAKNQFIQLAITLGISTDFDGKLKEFKLILGQIFQKLLQNAHVVLLVFDNAEALEDDQDLNLDGISCLLPKSLSPFFIEPTVIVTSRNQNWSLQNVIQLDLWTEAEVVVFVIQRLGLEETSENKELATKLGNLFGRLPIALQAAVAVIRQQTKRKKKYGIQNLIDEYHNGSRKVLAQKPLDANMRPSQTSFTMLVLWNVSLEKIVKFSVGELAIKILCFMAYLSPTRILQDFLFALFEKNFAQDSIENALEILEDYSLITCLSSADSDLQNVTIHRMIQDATIENLRTNEVQKSSIIFNENTFLNEIVVLEKLSAELMNYIKTLNTRALLRTDEIVDNLVHVTNHVSKNLQIKEFRDFSLKVAGVLQSTNDFTKSIELYKKVLQATLTSEVDSKILDTIRLKLDLAHAYRGAGFEQKSIDLCYEVLEDQTRDLGPHHSDTLETKCDIANTLRRQGKYEEAAGLFREVLQDFENNQDTSSEFFLTTKHSYAVLLEDQGKTREAFKILTQVFEQDERNPVLKSEILIGIKEDKANILKEQGKFEEASAMMLQNISDATQLFGPFHLNTFSYKRNYGLLLRDQGKHQEATQLLLNLLEIQETQLGSEHPDTLYTKNNLAVLYLDTKELDKVVPLLDVEARERAFGPEHPNTMTTANNLANVMTMQDKFRDALSLLNKVLKTQEKVIGPTHPNTLNTMHNIGVLYNNIKEFDKAAEVFQDLLRSQVEVLGENHPNAKATLEMLTDCREILDRRNDLIVNFMTLTLVDAEIGQSILEASNWNMEVALDIFFN